MSTFTQIHIHIVFSVRNHHPLMQRNREDIHKYIVGIIKNLGHKPIIVNGTEDHIHILIGLNPEKSLSSLVKEIKRCSTNFINKNKLSKTKFYWQEGYGAFSYGQSQIQNVIQYIKNQEEHHRKRSFIAEYQDILEKFEIPYEPKWLK